MTVVVHGLAHRQICGVGGWSRDPLFRASHDKNRASLKGHHLVTSPKAKSGATVCVVLWRDMNSSQLVGRQMKSSGDINTSGYLQQAGHIQKDAMSCCCNH